MNAVFDNHAESSPFLLENEGAYQAWRLRKLELRRRHSPTRVFLLNRHGRLPEAQIAAAQGQVDAFNFVLFEVTQAGFGKLEFSEFNRQFGLQRLDSNPGADADKVTALRVVAASDRRAQYIPYSNRGMNWHTDGYYNPRQRRINAFSLYCAEQAPRGGGNFLFDHEMMYLLIRDQAPELLEALMAPDMLRIPANVQDGRVIRAEETGPVFALQAQTGALHMRYTSRPHNIVWKRDRRSQRALDRVREILLHGSAVTGLRLRRGQGIVCNNILHGREAFQQDSRLPARLVYRTRYLDSIDLRGGAHG